MKTLGFRHVWFLAPILAAGLAALWIARAGTHDPVAAPDAAVRPAAMSVPF